jgi:DNA invertase Pin-like site-specific DNA recombinase
MEGRFVAYYRTSTKRQDLGIEAQRASVATYLNGGGWKVIAEFEEKESGTGHTKTGSSSLRQWLYASAARRRSLLPSKIAWRATFTL